MVVVMIENVYPVSNMEERVAGRSRKLPRNIRACGQAGGILPVYMEDYVETYIRRLTESGFPECSAVVLVGQVMETEIGRCLFVRGAINTSGICDGDRPVFGEKVWNEVYEKIRMCFPYDEVVGWCIAGPGFRLLQEDVFLRAHIDNFADREKIFCCYESLEKELVLRICEDGRFRILPGYYIYYEKNDEMQSYMLDETAFIRKARRGGQETQERNVTQDENKTKCIEDIQRRKEVKSGSIRKDIIQLAAIACIIVLIVSVMMGTDTLSKLKESVFAIGNGEQLVSEGEENADEGQNRIEDSEKLAFGDFDFLDKSTTEPDSTEQSEGVKPETEHSEQAETVQTGSVGEEKQEETQKGQKAEEQQETAQVNPDGAENTETAQENPGGAGKQEISQQDEKRQETAQRDENASGSGEENSDRIEEETVTVLAPTEYTSYTVKAGDTLAQVCKKVYGSVELLHYICELNQLRDVDSIYVGQELILPKK